MQSVVCTSRQIFLPKNVSCVIVNIHSLLWSFLTEESQTLTGTATCRNASICADSAISCSRNQKIIPIKLWSKSVPDRSLSFKTTPGYFAAALQTRLTFSGL